ncbi:hypothetical protein ACFVAV_30910 [Nocardia sp. NPDC057663]|uniref:hypothetical protein n=1 Tax=Nocardia sp. NPDC057663 TaxID=3346201 RepID=UPI00366EABA8
MTTEAWIAPEGDVHLRIWLGGMAFDYTASATVVGNLIQDCRQRHWCTVELVSDSDEDNGPFPRLPCEQLFLGP